MTTELAAIFGRTDDQVEADLLELIERQHRTSGADRLLLVLARRWLDVLLSRHFSAIGVPSAEALDAFDAVHRIFGWQRGH